jgi:hypothetical protein
MNESQSQDSTPRSFCFDVMEFIIIGLYVAVPLSAYFGLCLLLGRFHRSESWAIRILFGLASNWPIIFIPAAFRMARRHAAGLVNRRKRAAQH